MKASLSNRLDQLELGDGSIKQVFTCCYTDPLTGEIEIATTDPDGNPVTITGEEARKLQERLDNDPTVIKVNDDD